MTKQECPVCHGLGYGYEENKYGVHVAVKCQPCEGTGCKPAQR